MAIVTFHSKGGVLDSLSARYYEDLLLLGL